MAGKSDSNRQRGAPQRLGRAAWQAGLVVLVLYALHLYQVRDTVEGPAPAFAGVDLDGRSLSLAEHAGRPVLVHFWATWCPVCRAEAGNISDLAEDHAVITIALEDTPPAQFKRFLAERELAYPVIRDPEGELAARYGVRGVPASFVVDADGNIRFTTIGYTTEAGLRLRMWWAERQRDG
ncbi:protein disulfide oxidoreductase [Thiohalobacter sp.]|uniref:protein disulfide oxidoreductase n=1 Tax=Thiohalobacter sp. TaxID=2025948 RepID=UPI002601F571|nr:protein disulfide oxidoreductase [Thiohalobacter sp.]